MATTGRPTLLTAELQEEVCNHLGAGCTIRDVCDKLGFDDSTFYNWRKRGKAEIARRANARVRDHTQLWDAEQPYVEFFEATTRAQASANVNAVLALRAGFVPSETVTETTETFTETRLDKEGKPYQYTRTVQRKTKTKNPGDWRAAESFLKRRDPTNWSEHTVLRGEDDQGKPGPIPITFVKVVSRAGSQEPADAPSTG